MDVRDLSLLSRRARIHADLEAAAATRTAANARRASLGSVLHGRGRRRGHGASTRAIRNGAIRNNHGAGTGAISNGAAFSTPSRSRRKIAAATRSAPPALRARPATTCDGDGSIPATAPTRRRSHLDGRRLPRPASARFAATLRAIGDLCHVVSVPNSPADKLARKRRAAIAARANTRRNDKAPASLPTKTSTRMDSEIRKLPNQSAPPRARQLNPVRQSAALRRALQDAVTASPLQQPPATRTTKVISRELQRLVRDKTHWLLPRGTKKAGALKHAEVVTLRRQLLHQEVNRHHWSKLLTKEMRVALRPQLLKHEELQRAWLVRSALARFATRLRAMWVDVLSERARERQRHRAVARLQGDWRTSFGNRMEAKHARTFQLLRERAWVARMNVRCRQRSREALVVRRFCLLFADRSRFAQTIKLFKWRVVRCQRAARKYFAIQRARLYVLSKLWLRVEPRVLLDLETAARAKEAEADQRRRLRRMSSQSGLDEATLLATMRKGMLGANGGGDSGSDSGTDENDDEDDGGGDDAACDRSGKRKKKKKKKKKAKHKQTSMPRRVVAAVPRPPPRNVRLERALARQAAVMSAVDEFNICLLQREKLIATDTMRRRNLLAGLKRKDMWGGAAEGLPGERDDGADGEGIESLAAARSLPGVRPSPLAVILTGGPAWLGPLATVRRKRAHKVVSNRVSSLVAGCSGAGGAGGIVSRFKPMAKQARARVLGRFLSEAIREYVADHARITRKIQNNCRRLSMEDMKTLIAEDLDDEREEADGEGDHIGVTHLNLLEHVDSTGPSPSSLPPPKKRDSILADKLKTRELPAFVLPLFSRIVQGGVMYELCYSALEAREKRWQSRQMQAQAQEQEALRRTACHSTLKGAVRTSSATVRERLGEQLLSRLQYIAERSD